MPYTNGDGVYHDRRTCRRLHNTGRRVRPTDDTAGLDPCAHCTDDQAGDDVAQLVEAGVCPWCERDDLQNVGSHAAQIHPSEWDVYKKE